jgi:hypothetical protein
MGRYRICKNLDSEKCNKKEMGELRLLFDRYRKDRAKLPSRAESICQKCVNFKNDLSFQS